MAINGPRQAVPAAVPLQVRSLSGPHWQACRILRICASLFSWLPLLKLASKASAVAFRVAGVMSSEQVSAFSFLCQSFQAVVHQEVRAFVGHLVDQRFVAQQQFFQEQRELLVAYAGVVLGAGDGKFFQGNAPVQQVPGPGLSPARAGTASGCRNRLPGAPARYAHHDGSATGRICTEWSSDRGRKCG